MKRNRLLAMLLSLVMLLNMLPVTVWAESVPENFLFDISEGSVTIGSGTDSGTVKITYGDGAVKDNIDPSQPITVTGTTTANNITVTGSVSAVIVLKDLNIDVSSISKTSAVNLNGAGECTIQLDGENILKAGNDRPGIYVPKNNQVTFTGTGSLDVTGAASWPGIGRMGNGNILIESGTIVSTGGSNASGIGGSWGYEGGTITINGGKIEATGGYDAAGIGGGRTGNGGTITINGGSVTAKSGGWGAGIGGGYCGSAGYIVIHDGTVNASCTGIYGYGAGIGSGGSNEGSKTNDGTIIINGGYITATNQNIAAGIGGGCNYTSGTVIITGGNVTAEGGRAGIGGGQDGSDDSFTTNITNEGGTTTDGNAIIFASSITDQSGKTDGTWSGVIFEGNDGKVYGSTVTPAEDFEIASGKKLLIPEGSTLNITGINAVNNGNVYVDGAVSGLDGDLYYPLTVTGGSASPIYTYSGNTYGKAGETVTLTGTDVPVGQAVSGWTTSDGGVIVENNAFTMPSFALTVTAQYIDAPVLSDFSVTPNETPNSYTVKFTSDQAGTWYYTIDRKGTADTSDFTSWISGTCVEGENTITLTDQIAGEKIHLAVVNQYGLCSTVTDEIENDYTALFNALFAQCTPPLLNTPIYQHEAPSKEALEALLTERMNERINSLFDYENASEEELEMLRTLTSQVIVKQFVPAIAATAGTNGVDGSFIFEMEGSLCGWSTVAYLSDSDYEELDPTVIAEPYYTVTLNADGGSVNSGNVTGYVYGVGATLPTDMTRRGYGFAGWYDDETGEKVTAVSGTDWGNRSFTARWILGGNEPAYTVTIPATVELGGTATVNANGVTIVEGSQLVVTLSGTSDTGNAFKLTTAEGAELSYTVSIGDTALAVNEAVLTVAGGTATNSGSATLTFSKPTTAIQYSGDYKGTVTFSVLIEEVSTP